MPFALISNVSFQIGYNYDTTLSLFILYSFVLALIYGLHKREIWGFYLYIVYFIYAPIQYSFDKANLRILVGDDFNYDRFVFIGMVFGLLIYTLPNIIYIVKRKGLFISDVDGSVSTKEVLNTTPQQKKSHKQTKTDMIETVEKLKESKSDVVLTEKESHIKVESDTIETIKKLAKLKNDGILTEKEFSEKKKELLGRI